MDKVKLEMAAAALSCAMSNKEAVARHEREISRRNRALSRGRVPAISTGVHK